MSLDLTPFGIDCVLSKETDLKQLEPSALLHKGSSNAFLGRPTLFVLNDVSYKVEKLLGEGTYGATYHVTDPKGQPFAVKVLLEAIETKTDLQIFLKECIIQILMAETSQDEPDGPYVPRLYEVAYNADKKQAFLRSELMRNSLEKLMVVNTKKQNSEILPDAIIQITTMLEFFGKTLQFSHRDLKGDNIMYVRKNGRRIFKLIDFGLSCITWKGLTIHGGDYFPEKGTCFRKSRDIMQFLYYLTLMETIEASFRDEINELLVATIAAHDCHMGNQTKKDCTGLKNWRTSYNFLNRNNVSFAKGDPKQVRNTMKQFQKRVRTTMKKKDKKRSDHKK